MTALISLVITVYNREQYLPAAIESILTQSYPNFELLIWDDGSTDDSVEIAQHYVAQDKRIRVIAAPHQGRATALKAAIAATTGTYIGWVDSDDLLAQTALTETVAILEQQPNIGLVYTDYIVIDENDAVKGYGNRCKIPYSKEQLLLDFMIFHFRLMRRSVYDQVGGIDEAFMYCQDYDLCLKLSEVTEIYHHQKPLYYYRHHIKSISGEKRIEQILLSKQAIENALQRRGMTDEYELEFQIFARASLFRKAGSHHPDTLPINSNNPHQLTTSTNQFTTLPTTVNPNEFTNWALSTQALEWITQFIQTQGIKTVVELGSGLSTILLASLQQDGVIERSLTLEHDSKWYDKTVECLQQKGLQCYAQIYLCPLQQVVLNQKNVNWYGIKTLPYFIAGLILIDGPPEQNGLLARYPAPHLLKQFIQPGTWMILDDYHRQAERGIVKDWLAELPNLRLIEVVPIDTGLALLHFS
jgi:glycosyltransferase involved in cell wall biosynthesis